MNTTFSIVARRAMKCLLLLNLVLAAGTEKALAIDYANPTGPQDFTVGDNWVGGIAPGASDEAQINGVDGVTDYPYLDTTVSVQRLQAGTGGNSGGLELRSGASLSVTEETNGAMQIGEGVGGVGNLRVFDGASLNTIHTLLIGQVGGDATAIQDGGEVHAGLGLRLANGNGTTATYTLNDGTLVNGTVVDDTVSSITLFQIGGGTGTSGAFYMNGGSVAANGRFRMARNDAVGSFIQTDGDMLAQNLLNGNALELAMQGTSSMGLYEISGGSFTVTTNTTGIIVGSTGTAQGTFKVIGDAPTISIGTKYEQRVGGTLALEIGTGISPIDVTGLALLDGTLDVAFTAVPTVGQQFTIMTYTDLLSGGFTTFDNIVNSPLGADTVTLSIDYGTFGSIVLTVDSVAEVPQLFGDYNDDGIVNAADYALWRDTLDSTFDLAGNGDETGGSAGMVDVADYELWRANFGNDNFGVGTGAATVPEPGTFLLVATAMFGLALIRRR